MGYRICTPVTLPRYPLLGQPTPYLEYKGLDWRRSRWAHSVNCQRVINIPMDIGHVWPKANAVVVGKSKYCGLIP